MAIGEIERAHLITNPGQPEDGLMIETLNNTTGDPTAPLFETAQAVERIVAATEAAHALPFPFMLTARAHNLLYPNASLHDTIARLQAFERVGADVLFAPGLGDVAAVQAVCEAVLGPWPRSFGSS